MQIKSRINLVIMIIGLVIYIFLRADAWRLLLFSEKTDAVIINVNGLHPDPHTTAEKADVRYTFSDMNSRIFYGNGDRVLRNDENAKDLTWLTGNRIEIVYVRKDPSINNVDGRQYDVLFPLILIPLALGIDLLVSRRSNG